MSRMVRSVVHRLLQQTARVVLLSGNAQGRRARLTRLSTQYSVLSTLVLVFAACSGAQPAARLGGQAPDFTLQSVGGGPIRLADLKGKPVFINFWATWCEPCREEMPAMQAVYEQYRDRGLIILAIDMEEDER